MEELLSDNFDCVLDKLKNFLRNNGSELKEAFEVFSKQQSVNFWNNISNKTKSCIDRIITRCELSCSNETTSAEGESDLATLKCILDTMSCYCAASNFKPPSILEVLEHAHGLLTVTTASLSMLAIKFSLAKLCELWWLSNEEGAENLIAQLITHLLMAALSMDGRDTDVKRLYTIRGGFLLLDFEDESISFLRDLLHRSFVHPSFLRIKEGQKLLAFLIGSNQDLLVDVVTCVIRPQLTTGAKTVSAAYGKIIYQAWCDAENGSGAGVPPRKSLSIEGQNGCQQALEDCVQGLLRDGVHAVEAKYFRGVRYLLQAFHDVQRSKLDNMLLRIYDPILWRSLKCANAQVRSQAAVMFLDVFPLQHADGRAEDNDKILQKQFDLLAALLTDSDHQVRAHAAQGVCHILKEYWDSLPVNTTHNILKFLVDTLSVDASCANVRHAVFVGLYELFQQPLAHGVLKQLLPLLRNSIHDKAEKVRVAFIRILCQMKGIRGMHFYDVVSVDHLLERLAQDRRCPAVCEVMSELLLNSFFPMNDSTNSTVAGGLETEQLNRCIQFVDKNLIAAEAFYYHLTKFVSVGHVAKLATVLFTFLVTTEARAQKEAIDNLDNETGKRRRNTTAPVPLSLKVRVGMMRVVLQLLESVQDQLTIQHPARDLLAKYITEDHTRTLVAAALRYDTNAAIVLLPTALQLVSHSLAIRQLYDSLPKTDQIQRAAREEGRHDWMSMLVDVFVPAWTACSTEAARTVLAQAVVEVLCTAGEEKLLLAAVSRALEPLADVVLKKPRGKAKATLSPENDNVRLPVAAAIDLFASLSHDHLKNGKSPDCVFQLLRLVVERAVKEDSLDISADSLSKAVQRWLSFCIHEDASGSEDEMLYSLVALSWVTEHIVPCTFTSPLSAQLLSLVLAMISDFLYLDIANPLIHTALQVCLENILSTAVDQASTQPALLMSALCRIGSILNTTSGGSHASVSDLRCVTLRALLFCAEHCSNEERVAMRGVVHGMLVEDNSELVAVSIRAVLQEIMSGLAAHQNESVSHNSSASIMIVCQKLANSQALPAVLAAMTDPEDQPAIQVMKSYLSMPTQTTAKSVSPDHTDSAENAIIGTSIWAST